MLPSLGGVVVRVMRPGYDRSAYAAESVHPSETALDDWDDALVRSGHRATGPVNGTRLPDVAVDFVVVNDVPTAESFELHVRARLLPWLVDRFKFMLAT